MRRIIKLIKTFSLWDLLMGKGQPYQLIAAGDRALENLRIESFSLKSGKDFWSEHHPHEVDLHPAHATAPSGLTARVAGTGF